MREALPGTQEAPALLESSASPPCPVPALKVRQEKESQLSAVSPTGAWGRMVTHPGYYAELVERIHGSTAWPQRRSSGPSARCRAPCLQNELEDRGPQVLTASLSRRPTIGCCQYRGLSRGSCIWSWP